MSDLSLGQFIAKRREELGYKKVAFSNLIGVGCESLKKWETDTFIPAGINRRSLIKWLLMTPEQINHYFGSGYG